MTEDNKTIPDVINGSIMEERSQVVIFELTPRFTIVASQQDVYKKNSFNDHTQHHAEM